MSKFASSSNVPPMSKFGSFSAHKFGTPIASFHSATLPTQTDPSPVEEEIEQKLEQEIPQADDPPIEFPSIYERAQNDPIPPRDEKPMPRMRSVVEALRSKIAMDKIIKKKQWTK